MFRVQSLYLLISSAINFFILAVLIHNDYQDDLMDICRGVTSASGSLLLYLIFQHKKKKLQSKIIMIFLVIYFLFGFYLAFSINMNQSSFIVFGIISVCIFCTLAKKNIKKDINLINSADRLR
tara:strand:- start:39 stop:407 length:369 start_codon:yes stop_codon:yes gene_type:complete